MEFKDSKRVMALDYGKKRCGLAVTDPLRIIASPLETVSTPELISFLTRYAESDGFSELVVGFAPTLAGEANEIEKDILDFLTRFKQKFPHVIVHREDESFTSKSAADTLKMMGVRKKKRQQKGALDAVSAAIILQRFLDNQPF